MFVIFLAVALLAFVLLPGYIWWRMVRSTTRPGAFGAADEEVATPLEQVAYSWLGVALYLFLALLALEPVRLLRRSLQRRRASAHEPAEALTAAVPSVVQEAPRRYEATAHLEVSHSPLTSGRTTTPPAPTPNAKSASTSASSRPSVTPSPSTPPPNHGHRDFRISGPLSMKTGAAV
jgi:cytoskeletal protein RodZ